jgi:D-alanine-D-alanine ligase
MSVNENAQQHVAVLFGGPSDEYEVSCHSAANVVRALNRDRFIVTPIRITRNGVWIVGEEARLGEGADFDVGRLLHLTRDALSTQASSAGTSVAAAVASLAQADVVFPVLHGRYGEDGTVQALLELVGVRYVGNGLFASAAGMDKQQTKRLLAAEGLSVADGVVLERLDAVVDEPTRARLGLPVFVKPARSGSSFGVTKVNRWAELEGALELARQSDSKVLVERAVPGRLFCSIRTERWWPGRRSRSCCPGRSSFSTTARSTRTLPSNSAFRRILIRRSLRVCMNWQSRCSASSTARACCAWIFSCGLMAIAWCPSSTK